MELSCWSENYSLLGTCCKLGICCCWTGRYAKTPIKDLWQHDSNNTRLFSIVYRFAWMVHPRTNYFWHVMSQMRPSNSINSLTGQGVRGTCPRRRMKLHPNNLMLLMSSHCYIFVLVVFFEVTGVHLVKTFI